MTALAGCSLSSRVRRHQRPQPPGSGSFAVFSRNAITSPFLGTGIVIGLPFLVVLLGRLVLVIASHLPRGSACASASPGLGSKEVVQGHLEAIKGELRGYYSTDVNATTGQYHPHNDLAPSPSSSRASGVPAHTLVGEFLYDLRSALDHLAWQLVVEAGKMEPNPEGTHFPILRERPTSRREGVEAMPSIKGGISSAARQVAPRSPALPRRTRHSAKHLLWIMHQLWNIATSTDTRPQGRQHVFRPHGSPPPSSFTCQSWRSNEHSAELILVPDDPSVEVNAQIVLQAARPRAPTWESSHRGLHRSKRRARWSPRSSRPPTPAASKGATTYRRRPTPTPHSPCVPTSPEPPATASRRELFGLAEPRVARGVLFRRGRAPSSRDTLLALRGTGELVGGHASLVRWRRAGRTRVRCPARSARMAPGALSGARTRS